MAEWTQSLYIQVSPELVQKVKNYSSSSKSFIGDRWLIHFRVALDEKAEGDNT